MDARSAGPPPAPGAGAGEAAEAPIGPLVDHLFRRSAGRLVASLTRALGARNLDLAEEVVQDALLKALQTWPYRGVPDDPEAWLHRVARNRALDVLRREGRVEEHTEPERLEALAGGADPDSQGSPGTDDELAMLLMCCHPALAPDARVALTLRTVGGLSTDEIAAAFLTSRATVQQRIVRAKRQIADRGVALELPAGPALAQRRESVMAVLYLMFNEGHAATEGEALVRAELCAEAIRLARLLADHPHAGAPEVDALLALLLFQASRLPARAGGDGALVLLQDQDRALWDRPSIAEGFARLERATAADALTHWHVEAAIASVHAAAASWATTDWRRLVDLYDLLARGWPSPVVALNRAVALAMSGSPDDALSAVDGIDPGSLPGYALLPATRAYLLERAGRLEEATVELRRALMASRSEPVRAHLRRRLDALDAGR